MNNIECRFCKRFKEPGVCAATKAQLGPAIKDKYTGEWRWERKRTWDAVSLVKEGRGDWPCEPVLTWRGKHHYKNSS